jgi:hypothetical protein
VFVAIENAVDLAGRREWSRTGEESPSIERCRPRCRLTKQYPLPRAGCKGRWGLSDSLPVWLANVVFLDDESHWQMSRNVARVASSRSGIFCHGLAVRIVESSRISLSFWLTNVVVNLDDESHSEKPRDVDCDVHGAKDL